MKNSELVVPWTIGQQDILEEEFNDCSVRALANTENISYEKAHLVLARAGRKEKTAVDFIAYAAFLVNRGYSVEFFGLNAGMKKLIKWKFNAEIKEEVSLSTLLKTKKYKTGKHIFGTCNHLFAVDSGRIIDTGGTSLNASVLEVFTPQF